MKAIDSENRQQNLGSQRDWVWRGWQTRYTYIRARQNPQKKGTNPPILLLHGFGASIGHWRKNLAVLSEEHTVYALDLLGFGASEKAIAPYNADLWAEQVYEFWQTFIREPAILIGNSIGSLVALTTAASRPEMVRAVAAISLPDPAAQSEAIHPRLLPLVETLQNIIASPAILRPLFYLLRKPKTIRRWVKLAYADPDSVTDELVALLAGPPSDRGSARAFCILFRAMGSSKLGPSVKAILPALEIPILLIWGQQDRLIPASVAKPQTLIEYNSRLKFVELENAGHCPHDECPNLVNQLILDWIREWQPENP